MLISLTVACVLNREDLKLKVKFYFALIKTNMNKSEIFNYWLKTAKEDYETAKALLASRRFVHCLFFCHLAIEKLLKGFVVKETGDNPLPTHKLSLLAKKTSINFSNEQFDLLDELTQFNIQARYNDIKLALHKKANQKFTKEYFDKTTKLYLWLKKQF